jgi:hypothetical protein
MLMLRAVSLYKPSDQARHFRAMLLACAIIRVFLGSTAYRARLPITAAALLETVFTPPMPAFFCPIL